MMCYTVHMSTVICDKKIKNNLYKRRFVDIARIGQPVFHIDDLANLWQIKNPNTLHTTLKRYTQDGLIIRLQRGTYSLLPADKVSSLLIGIKTLHRYSYISTETVLAQTGIILQNLPKTTIVSSVSKNFSVAGHSYRCRRLSDKFLYNSAGLKLEDGIMIATTERAVADILYFDPHYFFDAPQLIDWKKVHEIQRQIGYHCL